MTLDEQLELLAKFPQAVKAAAMDAEDRMVDVLGTVSSVTSSVASWKRGVVAEVVDGEKGRDWVAKAGGSWKRSYNTTGLLTLISGEMDWSLPQTLAFLLNNDIVRLEWRWTPLNKFLRDNNILSLIIKREVEDGDVKFHIGEVWDAGYLSYKPIERDDDA